MNLNGPVHMMLALAASVAICSVILWMLLR